MRAGVSYNDWRQMTQWQRTSLFLKLQHRNAVFGHQMQNAENMAETLGVLLGRALNLD